MRTGPQRSVGAAATPDRPRRAPEPANTSGGLLYRTRRSGRADFTPLRGVPGAAITAHLGINDHGQITGTFIDTAGIPNPDGTFDTGHGFVQDRRGHTTSFDAPGARITLPNGINNHGQITGAYVAADATASVHGFLRDRRGAMTTFEVPFGRLHSVSDLNHRGQIVGYYDEPDFAGGGGFLRDRDGTITTIAYPGAPYTLVHGMNDRGQLVGAYLEPGAAPNPDGTIPAGTVHGFVWGTRPLHQLRRPRIDLHPGLRDEQPRPDRRRLPRRLGPAARLPAGREPLPHPGHARRQHRFGYQRPRRDRPARSPSRRAAAGGDLTAPAIRGDARPRPR
jgi:hypothetical protein